jgi:hypothetical protein
MYAYLRRQGLQDYLKAVIKVPLVVARSVTLQRFLELDKTSLNCPDMASK